MGSHTGWTPIAVLFAALAGGLLLAVGSASGQSVQDKRAQAVAIMAQVEGLNSNLEQTVEAWILLLSSHGCHEVAALRHDDDVTSL